MKNIEHTLQVVCVRWFKHQYPNLLIAAIPNGGKRNVIEAKRLKDEGVLAGMPDLFIAKANSQFHGLFIEMKKQESKIINGKLTTVYGCQSDSQKAREKELINAGYKYELCFNGEQFINIVKSYLALK
jgi:hypothetical protein